MLYSNRKQRPQAADRTRDVVRFAVSPSIISQVQTGLEHKEGPRRKKLNEDLSHTNMASAMQSARLMMRKEDLAASKYATEFETSRSAERSTSNNNTGRPYMKPIKP